jgi:hypothetical protein
MSMWSWTSFRGKPWRAALLVGGACLCFVCLRLAANGFNPSVFVLAGDAYSDSARLPAGFLVRCGSAGYDGQFFYRLARDPFTSQENAHGVRLDHPAYRHQRLGYPFFAWALSLGAPTLTPWTLLLVNLLAAALAAGFAAGLILRGDGPKRQELAGLAALSIGLYPGLLQSLARDLSEPSSIALLLAGLYALRGKEKRRFAWAGVCFSAAALCRETTLVLPLAGLGLGLSDRFLDQRQSRLRGQGRATPLGCFLAPLLVTAAWQLCLWALWGKPGVLAGGPSNLGPPGLGLVKALTGAVSLPPASLGLYLLELGFLALVGWASFSLVLARADRLLSAAWVVSALLLLCLTDAVWREGWAFLRAASEWFVFSLLLIAQSEGTRTKQTPRARVVLVFASGLGLWLLLFFKIALRPD